MAAPQQILATIDLELINNVDITAIGIYSGDKEGKTILKEEFWIKTDLSKMDPRCKEEFWDKHPELYELIENGGEEKAQVEAFIKAWDSIAEKAGVSEDHIQLVSDNAECDYGRLSLLTMKHFPERGPVRFTTKGKYRSIDGYDSAVWKLGIDKIIDGYANQVSPHDHRPSNDAHNSHAAYLIQEAIMEEIRDNYKDTKGKTLAGVAKEVGERVVKELTGKSPTPSPTTEKKRSAEESIKEILYGTKKQKNTTS